MYKGQEINIKCGVHVKISRNLKSSLNLFNCTVISDHKIYLAVFGTLGGLPNIAAGSCRKRTGSMYKVCRVSQEAKMRCERGSGLQERPVVSVTTLPPHIQNGPHASKLMQS